MTNVSAKPVLVTSAARAVLPSINAFVSSLAACTIGSRTSAVRRGRCGGDDAPGAQTQVHDVEDPPSHRRVHAPARVRLVGPDLRLALVAHDVIACLLTPSATSSGPRPGRGDGPRSRSPQTS